MNDSEWHGFYTMLFVDVFDTVSLIKLINVPQYGGVRSCWIRDGFANTGLKLRDMLTPFSFFLANSLR